MASGAGRMLTMLTVLCCCLLADAGLAAMGSDGPTNGLSAQAERQIRSAVLSGQSGGYDRALDYAYLARKAYLLYQKGALEGTPDLFKDSALLFDRAAALGESDPFAFYMAGRAYNRLGWHADAIRCLSAVPEASELAPRSLLPLAYSYAMMASKRAMSAGRDGLHDASGTTPMCTHFFLVADRVVTDGDRRLWLKRAQEYLSEAESVLPDDADVLYMKALILRLTDDMEGKPAEHSEQVTNAYVRYLDMVETTAMNWRSVEFAAQWVDQHGRHAPEEVLESLDTWRAKTNVLNQARRAIGGKHQQVLAAFTGGLLATAQQLGDTVTYLECDASGNATASLNCRDVAESKESLEEGDLHKILGNMTVSPLDDGEAAVVVAGTLAAAEDVTPVNYAALPVWQTEDDARTKLEEVLQVDGEQLAGRFSSFDEPASGIAVAQVTVELKNTREAAVLLLLRAIAQRKTEAPVLCTRLEFHRTAVGSVDVSLSFRAYYRQRPKPWTEPIQ